MAVGDAHVCPGFLTPVLTHLFSPKPPITFLTCFCRGERRKYAGKKVRLNRGSNSQPPGQWVRHDHHWDTRAGFPYFQKKASISLCTQNSGICLIKGPFLAKHFQGHSLSVFFPQDYVKLKVSDTSSDWLYHTVKPIRSCLAFKCF